MCRSCTIAIMWEAVLACHVERVNVNYGCQDKNWIILDTSGSVNGIRIGFCRSKQSRKLELSFLCICAFRKREGLYGAVKMQLVSMLLCSLSSTQYSHPAALFQLRNGLSGCGFLPCRSELSRWWISEACSSHVKARCEHFPSSVCGSTVRWAALLTWQVEVVWDWSAAWCWGGKGPLGSSWRGHFCWGGKGAHWAHHCSLAHLPPSLHKGSTSSQVQALHRLFWID